MFPFRSPGISIGSKHKTSVSGGGGSWVPTDETGLLAWLDGSDASHIYQDSAKTTPVSSDGDPAGALEDKSGNGKDFTQATGGREPTYEVGEQNGLSVIKFVNTSLQYYACSITATQQHIFIVAKNLNAANNNNSLFNDGTTTGNWWSKFNASGTKTLYPYNDTDAEVSGLALSFSLIEFVHDGINATAILNTVSGTPLAVSPAEHTYLVFGSRRTSGDYTADLLLGEILFYNAAKSGSALASARSYLNTKWALGLSL